MSDSFWSGRRVAITGATGFLGHHVALLLKRAGADATALVRATSDRSRLVAAGVRCVVAPFDDPRALVRAMVGSEIVLHLAGAVAFTEDWERYRQGNVEGTRGMLEAARAAGARRVVHTSSIVAVSASRRPVALDESATWNLGRLRVPYATTKREAEELALAARGVEVVVANPASVIGPDDFAGSEFGTLCKRFWRKRVPVHFGGGNNFVDVRDVADGLLRAAQRGRPGERYILGGTNRTWSQFFADLSEAAGRRFFWVRMPRFVGRGLAEARARWSDGDEVRPRLTVAQAKLAGYYFFFDSGKAERELGYRTRPLAESLADAFAFWTRRAS